MRFNVRASPNAESDISWRSIEAITERNTGASCRERCAKPSLTMTAARSGLIIAAQNASSKLPVNTGS